MGNGLGIETFEMQHAQKSVRKLRQEAEQRRWDSIIRLDQKSKEIDNHGHELIKMAATLNSTALVAGLAFIANLTGKNVAILSAMPHAMTYWAFGLVSITVTALVWFISRGEEMQEVWDDYFLDFQDLHPREVAEVIARKTDKWSETIIWVKNFTIFVSGVFSYLCFLTGVLIVVAGIS